MVIPEAWVQSIVTNELITGNAEVRKIVPVVVMLMVLLPPMVLEATIAERNVPDVKSSAVFVTEKLAE